MNIHEYQAKELLRGYGTPLLKGQVVTSSQQAYEAAQKLGGNTWVVKAQIHAGGRGKGGGVRIARSLEEVKTIAQAMLGMQLVTPQTKPEGQLVKYLYIEQGCEISKEYYFSFFIDRKSRCVTAMASCEGGGDIEKIAHKQPEAIIKVTIDPLIGFRPFHGHKLVSSLGFKDQAIKEALNFFSSVYKTFTELDAGLIEINPLVLTTSNEVIALDAKISFDDNGLFRHPELLQLRDENEEDPLELEAKTHELNYIRLNGNIGCMVNGAGLAMATMDVIKLYGGNPANFLDVGGGATRQRVAVAFELILSDPQVKVILVNIFGGIMRCDIIADGIVAAAKQINLKVPLVVRLAGTNVEEGKKILASSGLPVVSASNLGEAALLAVKAAQEVA